MGTFFTQPILTPETWEKRTNLSADLRRQHCQQGRGLSLISLHRSDIGLSTLNHGAVALHQRMACC